MAVSAKAVGQPLSADLIWFFIHEIFSCKASSAFFVKLVIWLAGDLESSLLYQTPFCKRRTAAL
jgi:hypothetical protein